MASLRSSVALAAVSATLVLTAASAQAAGPEPGTPEYAVRDTANIVNAYGRTIAPGGQLQNPAYLPALIKEIGLVSTAQLLAQAATPTRPALTAALAVPGWNVGNPLRAGWNGTRGVITPVSFTNRFGALLRGQVFTPKPGARDPYTGQPLVGPFPGVVITPGSVQGSSRMYHWLAQDLAERGYVVMTYDVQGQGTSETFPHQTGSDFPFCNPLAAPEPTEQTGCPGVPFQQSSNFVKGTEDATDFFFSTPSAPYANPGAASTPVDAFNPAWQQFDRSADPRTVTPGRDNRFAIVGHSLGASAIASVQATDERVAAAVALDKLNGEGTTPVVPTLAVQSEYGFTVNPAALSGGTTLAPAPGNPEPLRERRTGFDAWQAAGVDSMLVVPRASTHLDYTDIPLVMPASRFGQALTSVYVQRWLDRYLKHATGAGPLLATTFPYLEPVGKGVWKPITLQRDPGLSFYYCSAYALTDTNGMTLTDPDLTGVGCS